MSLSRISNSFGNSFDFDFRNTQALPKQTLVMSPIKKRSRPEPEISDNNISLIFNNEVMNNSDSDLCANKKIKYTIEKMSNEPSIDMDIINIAPFKSTILLQELTDSFDFINRLDGDVKEQTQLIANSIPFQNFHDSKKTQILSLIVSIVNNPFLNNDYKCAELGVLYFYITSKEQLNDSHFIQYRTNEMITEAISLWNKHKEDCAENQVDKIPSGYKAYLLLAFVRMIFTSDGGFNPGGCKALKIMMQGPLQKLISVEERQQIIRIADRLLVDQEFLQLFLEPFEIHEELKTLISKDVQLPKNMEIDFIYLRWDLLIALISPITQHDGERNCYTIASTSNFIVNSPNTMIKMLLEVLKTGKMEFGGRAFPVSTMLESSRRNETDFVKKISPQEISKLTPILVARDRLNKPEQPMLTDNRMSLNDYLDLQFGVEAFEAKELILSLKQNLLQKLLISMVQFAAINTHSKGFKKNTCSRKESLVQSIISEIKLHLTANSKIDFNVNEKGELFLKELKNIFLENLYFVDYNNWTLKIEDKKVLFPFHKNGINFNGNRNDYKGLIKQRRLFCYNNENLTPIDTITELKTFLSEIVSKAGLEDIENCNSEIIDYFKSDKFNEFICTVLFDTNKRRSELSADVYKDSDSFLLIQTGSETVFLETWDPMSSQLKPITIKATDPADFFEKLCRELSDHANDSTEFAQSMNRWLLIEHSTHLYNIYPHLFKEYWDDIKIKFEDTILDQTIFNRVKICKLTKEKKERILMQVVGQTTMENHYDHLLDNESGIAQFYNETKKLLPSFFKDKQNIEYHDKLDKTINTVMCEISEKEVKAQLKPILSGIASNAYLETYYSQMMDKIEKLAVVNPYFHPYQLANIIHDELMSLNAPGLISIGEIEKHIRKWTSLPEVIDIGNMNWSDTLSEMPSFSYLSIKYDFVKGLIFCYREKGEEFPIDDDTLRKILGKTVIYLPR